MIINDWSKGSGRYLFVLSWIPLFEEIGLFRNTSYFLMMPTPYFNQGGYSINIDKAQSALTVNHGADTLYLTEHKH